MQFQSQCGHYPSVTQPRGSLPQNQPTTMINGFPQNNIQRALYRNATQSCHGNYENSSGGNGSERSASALSNDTPKTSNVGASSSMMRDTDSILNQYANQGQMTLGQDGLNPAQMQHVQTQSLMNTQNFLGASSVLCNPANQQGGDTQDGLNNSQMQHIHAQSYARNLQGSLPLQCQPQLEDIKKMPTNVLGSNQPQQLQQFSQSTNSLIASSSTDAKRQMLIQQRHAIQQL